MTENLTNFILQRNNIITNIDPDGFFSYAILYKFFNSELVGFSNSKECVYLATNKPTKRDEVTYVDMYVAPNDLQSIDQHIVSFNEEENKFYQNLGTKLNPNIFHERSFQNYKIKYPFSTFIYLCTLLDKEGYNVKLNWHKKITDDLELGHILLRIDGVITNLSDYSANCIEWLKWSKMFSNDGTFITDMYEFINSSVSVLQCQEISGKVETFFNNNFKSESKDGGYKEINQNNFQYIISFLKFAFDLLDIKWDDRNNNLKSFSVYTGEKRLTEQISFNSRQKDIFSCAIVNMREKNFSYTTNINYFKNLIIE